MLLAGNVTTLRREPSHYYPLMERKYETDFQNSGHCKHDRRGCGVILTRLVQAGRRIAIDQQGRGADAGLCQRVQNWRLFQERCRLVRGKGLLRGRPLEWCWLQLGRLG